MTADDELQLLLGTARSMVMVAQDLERRIQAIRVLVAELTPAEPLPTQWQSPARD